MKRGDIVTCVLSGDYGKPRPAVIVQSDLFNPTHSSIVLCPITSHLMDAPFFRLPIEPTQKSGLTVSSQVMVDKLNAVKAEKIHAVIGHLSLKEIQQLDDAIKLWLGLAFG